MSLASRTVALAKVATFKNIQQHADWGEQTVTAVAAGLGVLIVALVAVLMGMT